MLTEEPAACGTGNGMLHVLVSSRLIRMRLSLKRELSFKSVLNRLHFVRVTRHVVKRGGDLEEGVRFLLLLLQPVLLLFSWDASLFLT